jgi:hypothetical protein
MLYWENKLFGNRHGEEGCTVRTYFDVIYFGGQSRIHKTGEGIAAFQELQTSLMISRPIFLGLLEEFLTSHKSLLVL